MRLCSWAAAQCLLPVLLLPTVLWVKADQLYPWERHYYIAAVEIDWKYSGNALDRFSPTYKKVVFREYDQDFRQAKTHPSWLGLLGPTLRAEEGETIVVTFKNLASGAYSLHAHGVAYGKQSEGANYFDNTSQKEKEDDVVQPNSEHIYYWEVTSEVSPQPDDPTCLTYTYISHQNVVEDYNSGLIGALLICKPGSLGKSGKQTDVHQEYVFLFGVFDEKESKYKPTGHASDDHVKYTINGYTKGSLPDISVCAYTSVRLHLLGMSSEPEVFSVHLNGHVLQQTGHKVASVGLISGSSVTASMTALHTGRWLLSSTTVKHMEAGLHGFVNVTKCDGFEAPRRRMTIAQQRHSKEWKYYIAAEEVVWDYSPNMHEHVDEDFKFQYLRQSPTRIGQKYKKAVYTQYENESFTQRKETKQRKGELGILGPVVRAQVRDVIKIVFKNMASRPYSIYPHGLTIEKSAEDVSYPEGGNQSRGVQPGETYTYVWRVVEDDEPLEGDSRCLTRMYHSAVDTPRDIASGLIGPMLICKSQSLNVRNVQLKSDKEQHAMFAVFDENKSWYLDSNIRQYCDRSKVNKADPEFQKSNVMHTINGYAFESGPLLGFCNGEIATWHVSSIGAQDYIQTATFYGHTFELNKRVEDFLSLYPMTGETITMNMDNIGVWLLASLNSHETTKGMRVKFHDAECYRDSQYEYNDEDGPTTTNNSTEWLVLTFDEMKTDKKKDNQKNEIEKPLVIDEYTDLFANELGLRSLRTQSGGSDMVKLDLSFLDYDVIDVLDGDLNVTESKSKNETSSPNPNTLNGTLVLSWKDTDAVNHTVVTLLNQSSSENTTHVQNSSAPSVFDSSPAHKTENLTVLSVLPQIDNITTNNRESEIVSTPHNISVSDTNNTTVHNATALSVVGNVSRDITNLTATLLETADFTITTLGNLSSTVEAERVNVTLTGDNQTTVGSEETFNRGDVFSYSVPLSDSSNNSLHGPPEGDVSVTTLSRREDENNTVTNHVDTSADQTGHSFFILEADVGEGNISSTDRPMLELEMDNLFNKSNANDSLDMSELDNGPQIDTSETVPNSSQENVTHVLLVPLQNVTVNTSSSNSSEELSSEAGGNITALPHESNHTFSVESFSNETEAVKNNSSGELSEELFIYLKENNTHVIKTTSVKMQGHNWTYEGVHEMVPMEMPNHVIKYFEKETPQTTPTPKKIKKVTLRKWPQKGQGLKTKKRKEYSPLAKSGLPFSPRGFNPGMTPHGSRPISPEPFSHEEQLINMPVVIGVPRTDFSNYELYLPGNELDHLELDEHDVKADEYEYVNYRDLYKGHEEIKRLNLDEATKYHLKFSGPNERTYFIAAEEVQWDYGGYGQKRQDKLEHNSRETTFTKVVFQGYLDSSFTTPDVRGEIDEHLGILGPVIKAEVGQSIIVVFRNNANRPYSLHPNGVSYTKRTEGLSYEDASPYWYKYDNEVQPNTTFTYLWEVSSMVGPTPDESNCRTWAYYSGVNPERDIHSGLIGPLLVCREGTLDRDFIDTRDFMLLFMTFDESQSWYYEKNREMIQRKNRRRLMDPNFMEHLKFHTINGIIYNLKGLRMYTNQLVCWHLISMGSPKDFQSVHFHGQTFVHKKTTSYRQAVYPLLPGGFATLEMYPSKPGLWQLETEIGFNQQKGMQTLFLVLDNDCYRPLGLESGSVKDDHITAINVRGYWEPYLARLNNQGKYNAWSTDKNNSWIQVDFQRPVVISQVATQGAKQLFHSQYVTKYAISYSTDRRRWTFYRGDSRDLGKVFTGNQDAYGTKRNTFYPPMVGRFIRLHPVDWYGKATVRMEFYGCELDGCSVPLGMESGLIEDERITASSVASSWYAGPWRPSLARLNQQGTVNAWQAKYDNMNQWLQVELPHVKKITGIITQGAKSLGKEMYVMSYILQYSDNGVHWNQYTDDENLPFKIFSGNKNNSDHVKNYIHPPIFSRFIRIIPKSWMISITLRIELLGCDFE